MAVEGKPKGVQHRVAHAQAAGFDFGGLAGGVGHLAR
jgi:hypothetical protein